MCNLAARVNKNTNNIIGDPLYHYSLKNLFNLINNKSSHYNTLLFLLDLSFNFLIRNLKVQ